MSRMEIGALMFIVPAVAIGLGALGYILYVLVVNRGWGWMFFFSGLVLYMCVAIYLLMTDDTL